MIRCLRAMTTVLLEVVNRDFRRRVDEQYTTTTARDAVPPGRRVRHRRLLSPRSIAEVTGPTCAILERAERRAAEDRLSCVRGIEVVGDRAT